MKHRAMIALVTAGKSPPARGRGLKLWGPMLPQPDLRRPPRGGVD